AEMLCGYAVHLDRLESAGADDLLSSTDLADLLVRQGTPFREAHGIVAGLVRRALDGGKRLSELTDDELAEAAPQLGAELRAALEPGASVESKGSEGGTSLPRVREQLAQARAVREEGG